MEIFDFTGHGNLLPEIGVFLAILA